MSAVDLLPPLPIDRAIEQAQTYIDLIDASRDQVARDMASESASEVTKAFCAARLEQLWRQRQDGERTLATLHAMRLDRALQVPTRMLRATLAREERKLA